MNGYGRRLVYVQGDALLNVSLETLGLDLKFVVANRQLQKDVSSDMICHCRASQTGFGLLSVYRRAPDDSAARIHDGSSNTSRDLLRRRVRA